MEFPAWLIRLSVAVNNLSGGPQGYSLCARLWEGKLNGSRTCAVLVTVTDTLFSFDPQHCRKAWLQRTS